jgi:peptide chain release factor subunit 1
VYRIAALLENRQIVAQGVIIATVCTMTVELLETTLDTLAAFESDTASVVSLYLDVRPAQRSTWKQFVEAAAKEHEDLQADFDRIRAFMQGDLGSSTQALAIFSCSAAPPLFETLRLDGAVDGHRLYIDREPHLFPLARLADQLGTYAALLLNTNSARLYVFSAGAAQRQETVRSKKGKRVSAGGWSQARYQRRLENLHQKHMKEVAAAVEQVVKDEQVRRILVAGDQVAIPLLRDHLSPQTRNLLMEVGGLDMSAADSDVYRTTLEAFREADIQSDAEWVSQAMNGYRARGLATVGIAGVKAALERGQVDRLLVPAMPTSSAADHQSSGVDSAGTKEERGQLDEAAVEELVTMAKRTDAHVTFIEDARLLEPAKGVGAILRFRV